MMGCGQRPRPTDRPTPRKESDRSDSQLSDAPMVGHVGGCDGLLINYHATCPPTSHPKDMVTYLSRPLPRVLNKSCSRSRHERGCLALVNPPTAPNLPDPPRADGPKNDGEGGEALGFSLSELPRPRGGGEGGAEGNFMFRSLCINHNNNTIHFPHVSMSMLRDSY
jgi:hypothetical protein